METAWSQWTFQHNIYIEIGLGVEAGWRSKWRCTSSAAQASPADFNKFCTKRYTWEIIFCLQWSFSLPAQMCIQPMTKPLIAKILRRIHRTELLYCSFFCGLWKYIGVFVSVSLYWATFEQYCIPKFIKKTLVKLMKLQTVYIKGHFTLGRKRAKAQT